jgi:hypothetical protein
MTDELSIADLTEEIKKVLSDNDLLKITPKLVRESLEKVFECDLTSKKTLIDQIIVEELQRINNESNGDQTTDDEDDLDNVLNDSKKRKLTDEQLAVMINNEEMRNQRSKRSTTVASTVRVQLFSIFERFNY